MIKVAMYRPPRTWQTGARHWTLGERTWIMAILNLTPDSFHSSSRLTTVAGALAAAERALQEGADILDLGGESTRPGSPRVDPATEQQRLMPVLRELRRGHPEALISVDTYHASTAAMALDAGADMINDVTGLGDPAMGPLLARTGAGAILMHRRGEFGSMHQLPPLPDPVATVTEGFQSILARAREAQIAEAQIMLDPGFGFGKNLDENFPLLAHFSQWHGLGFPLLSALSRKSFLGHALGGVPSAERLYATVAALTASILQGAHVLRVHDVRPAVDAAKVADRILAAAGSGSRLPGKA